MTNSEMAPDRVCMNFSHSCNMNCQFCYIPFLNIRETLPGSIEVINILADWGTKVITIGGGDPFKYKWIHELVSYIRKKGITVHLDTNWLLINENDINWIKELVQIIGIPIDGHNEKIHGIMRGNYNHFNKVISIIEKFENSNTKIKINTVMTKINRKSIPNICEIISRYPIYRWSIYEFWPIGAIAKRNKEVFYMERNDFLDIYNIVKEKFAPNVVENGLINYRYNTYFFVRPNGGVYTVSNNDINSYVELGMIFNKNILKIWSAAASKQANRMRMLMR